MAPRLCDYVFQCVFISPAVSGLSKWVLVLPSWAGTGGSTRSALRTEVWLLFQDCVKAPGAENCTSTAPFRIWQLKDHIQPNQFPPSVSLSPGAAQPLEGFRQFIKLHQALLGVTVSAWRSLWFPVQSTGPSAWDAHCPAPMISVQIYHLPTAVYWLSQIISHSGF